MPPKRGRKRGAKNQQSATDTSPNKKAAIAIKLSQQFNSFSEGESNVMDDEMSASLPVIPSGDEKPKATRGRPRKKAAATTSQANDEPKEASSVSASIVEKPKATRGRPRKKAVATPAVSTTSQANDKPKEASSVSDSIVEKPKAPRGRKKAAATTSQPKEDEQMNDEPKLETPSVSAAAATSPPPKNDEIVDVSESESPSIAIAEKPKATRGRKKKVHEPVQLDSLQKQEAEIVADAKPNTRGKPVELVESSQPDDDESKQGEVLAGKPEKEITRGRGRPKKVQIAVPESLPVIKPQLPSEPSQSVKESLPIVIKSQLPLPSPAVKSLNLLEPKMVSEILTRTSLPLQKLIPLRLISKNFKVAIEHICKAKTSLKLFESYQEVKNFVLSLEATDVASVESHLKLLPLGKDDDLVIPISELSINDDKAFANFFKTLFPNINDLVLGFNMFNFNSVELLSLWSNLQCLTIRANFSGLNPSGFEQFVIYLNGLYRLERLDLQIPSTRVPFEWLKTTFGRLKHLTVKMPADETKLEAVLEYGITVLGPECRYLAIDTLPGIALSVDGDDFEKCVKANPNLSNLTHLSLANVFHYSLLEYVYENLTKLQYLNIDLVDKAYDSHDLNRIHLLLDRMLPNLTALTELRITNTDINLVYLNPHDVAPLMGMKILQFDDTNKPLGIRDDHGDPPIFDAEHWCASLAIMFPNLEHLIVRSGDKKRLAGIRKHVMLMKKLKWHMITDKKDRNRFNPWFGRHYDKYKKDRKHTEAVIKPVTGLVFADEDEPDYS